MDIAYLVATNGRDHDACPEGARDDAQHATRGERDNVK
jgi:hypothetical protein